MAKKKTAKKSVKKVAKKLARKVAKKKAAKKKALNRPMAEDKTQISISLPVEVVALIDRAAAEQNRNRSNFIANEMMEIVEEYGY